MVLAHGLVEHACAAKPSEGEAILVHPRPLYLERVEIRVWRAGQAS